MTQKEIRQVQPTLLAMQQYIPTDEQVILFLLWVNMVLRCQTILLIAFCGTPMQDREIQQPPVGRGTLLAGGRSMSLTQNNGSNLLCVISLRLGSRVGD